MPTPLSRRRFLQGSAAIGAATAIGACSSRSSGQAEPDAVPTGPDAAPAADGTLVVVTLYGGNDALNMVAPVQDPRYAELRGDVALDPSTTHPIGEGFALHPSLARSAELWATGQLAVVHGVGFDDLDRSHFHCMDEWQAAGDDHTTGWLGRWLDRVGEDPLDAVVVGRRLPLLARGASHSATVVPAGPFELPDEAALRPLLDTMANGERAGLAALVADSTADLLSVVDRVGPLLTAPDDEADDLGTRLATVADLIEADLPTRTYAVDLGGFDTHSGQADQQAALLGALDGAVADFVARVAGRPVTVLVYSEFGRRVAPNASAGTDHGQAGTVLLAGDVRSGHHGDPPPLDDLADGDLRTTTDFRSVYGAVLEQVLGIEAGDVIDGAPRSLALV